MATKTPTATAWDRLEELRETARERERQPGLLRREHEQALRGVEEARQALQAFYATGDGDEAQLKEALKAAQGAAADSWEDRAIGAQAAARAAHEECSRFVAEHVDEIASEIIAHARRARDELTGALEAVGDAQAGWRNVAGEWQLLRDHLPGGPYAATVPISSTLDEATRAIARAFQAGVPLPVPPALLRDDDSGGA